MQLSLLLDRVSPRPHKQQQQTARTVYRAQREIDKAKKALGKETREAQVLRCLAAYWNRYQESPTARELYVWMKTQGEPIDDINSVRPKLFYLEAKGLIRVNTARVCRESGEIVRTWKVREIGDSAT